MVKQGHADAMIAGVVGGFTRSLNNIINVIGKAEGIDQASTRAEDSTGVAFKFWCV